MYCPNCGAQNQENVAYCRSCGDDLKIISQVMKKHLPVALVSKLDAVIEQKNERLRRDAVYQALAAIAFLVLAVSTNKYGFGLIVLLQILLSIESYLAYRRSKELKTKSLGAVMNDELRSFKTSQAEELPNGTGIIRKGLAAVSDFQDGSIPNYCPRCGTKILGTFPYCGTCGCDLNFSISPTGLERYLPVFLVKRLDARIAKNEDAYPHYNGWWVIFSSFILLFSAIVVALDGNWGWMIFLLFMGFSSLIIGGWDLVSYRRRFEKNGKLSNISSASPTNRTSDISPPQVKTQSEFEAETQRQLPAVKAKDEIEQFDEVRDQKQISELTTKEFETERLNESATRSRDK